MIVFILFSLIILGEGKVSQKDALQAMFERNQEIKTKEYVVKIDGVEFKKIEAEGNFFYFRTLKRQQQIPIYLCSLPEGYRSERLVETSIKINKRKRFFFQVLRQRCSTTDPKTGRPSNSKRTWVEIDPVIGIHIPDQPNDIIKNKKIGIDSVEVLKGRAGRIQLMGDF